MGTQRIPVTGERCGSDATSSLFCFQFKCRRMLPTWLWDWLTGIVLTAQSQQKVGVLVLKVPRMRDTESIVIMKWKDFIDLHGAPTEPEVRQ